MSVVEETAIAIDLRIGSLRENLRNASYIQTGSKRRPGRSSYTVGRPKHLRQPTQLNHLSRFFSRMLGGKAAVLGGMPILRGDDQVEKGLEAIRERDYLVAFRNRE